MELLLIASNHDLPCLHLDRASAKASVTAIGPIAHVAVAVIRVGVGRISNGQHRGRHFVDERLMQRCSERSVKTLGRKKWLAYVRVCTHAVRVHTRSNLCIQSLCIHTVVVLEYGV